MNSGYPLKPLVSTQETDLDRSFLSAFRQPQFFSPPLQCDLISADDVATAQAMEQRIGQLFADTPYATLDHDPLWLLQDIQNTPRKLKFLLLSQKEQVQGFMPLFEHPAVLSFLRLGDVPVLWQRIRRRQIIGGPLLPGNITPEQQEYYALAMFQTLRRQLNRTAAIFLFGTPHDSALGRLLHSRSPLSANFYVIPYGPAYKRCLIDLPETFDAYLAKLSGTTRKDLRRTRQKFQTAFAGVFEVRTFSTLQEVPAYVKDAGEVVQQTYQWKLYGSGLTKTSQLEYAAEQGLLRCYVLYIEGRPAAFQTGYLYRDTYYAYATGYLSQYSKHQIGIFLLTEIFSELLTAGRPVKRLDFMQGENVSKTRLSTDIREERDYYLIPKTLRGALLACFLKTSLVFADVVKHISERTGIRAHIKKLLKRGLRG